jgi:hypothetical protein
VVAAQVLSRALWIGAALAAASVLVVLALHGERPATIGVFAAAGVMRHIPPEDVSHVEVVAGTTRWQFTRKSARWESSNATQGYDAKTSAAIDQGLRLLHNSAPERTLAGEEGSGAFGLAAPAMVITVKGPESFSIAFGGTNPLGLARYARVQGQRDVILLPRYVADAWQQAVGLQSQ